jgi:hypothetical protein
MVFAFAAICYCRETANFFVLAEVDLPSFRLLVRKVEELTVPGPVAPAFLRAIPEGGLITRGVTS